MWILPFLPAIVAGSLGAPFHDGEPAEGPSPLAGNLVDVEDMAENLAWEQAERRTYGLARPSSTE